MSLSRVLYQAAGMRVMKDVQAPKLSGDSAVKSRRDSSSSSKKLKTTRFSVIVDSKGSALIKAEKSDKVKKAEESLRTVMYLSCWGPN